MQETLSDADLIDAIRAGGRRRREAETVFFRQYRYLVVKRPRRYRLSEEEARDAYTDAVIAVVDHIAAGRFRGESSVKTYLSRIFRNKCVDQHRKNTTVSGVWTDLFPELPDASRDFLRELMGREAVQQVMGYLAQVGDRCRQLLLLSGEGYSPAEIAAELGFKSPGSASSQRYKCLEKLKTLMGQPAAGPD